MRYFLLLCIAAFAVAGFSQDSIYTFKVDVPLVTVDVTVTDEAGRAVTSLTVSDFIVAEDGAQQKVVSFNPVETPYNVLLLFDRSASTRGQWDFMKRAVERFVRSARSQDRVEIAAFDDTFKVLSDWEAVPEKSLSALNGVLRESVAEETVFTPSLERAVEREFRNVKGRRAIIAFTDGRDSKFYKQTVKAESIQDSSLDRDFQNTRKLLRESRIPVYFVAMNTDRNLSETPGGEYLNLKRVFAQRGLADPYLTEVRVRLEQLADASGGKVFFPQTIESVEPIYAQIRRELSTSYSLGYISPKPSKDGSYRRIEVRLKNNRGRISQSREGYYAR